MPPPFFELARIVSTRSEAPARICLRRGYRPIQLPVEEYSVSEVCRNEKYWLVQEMSDGYTYRIQALDGSNPHFGRRLSIWQNDFAAAVYGNAEEEV